MPLVVLTGGARSGKSSAAQRLAESRAEHDAPVTIAVFGRASDAEMEARILRHQADRPDSFHTLEVADPSDWTTEIDAGSLLVVDCLGTLLGLVMEQAWEECGQGSLGDAAPDTLPDGYADKVTAAFVDGVEWLRTRSGDTIVVTNEVGLGLVPGWASGRLFRDLLGQANRTLVNAADSAYLIVAGRALDLKASPAAVLWPED